MNELIDGYLDETLTPDEQTTLAGWIKERPDNARRFAETVMLHDRLRGTDWLERGIVPSAPRQAAPVMKQIRPMLAVAASVALALLVAAVLWKGAESSAFASAELNRIIAMSARQTDRTYRITVEELATSHPDKDRNERARPPKPPMDGAVLHVRGGRQFVLVRQTAEGRPFVTGSNGRTSWAVKPDGPVRVSDDLTRFSHDLPGHEHEMPLDNLSEGLERLVDAFETQVLPVETPEETSSDEEPSRLLVAVKKRGFRGPKRVEITYAVRSGHIQQMRFIEMPYGPERLTLRLTLVEERDLGAAFFDHESHHGPERKVEVE